MFWSTTPLHLAVGLGHDECVEALIEAGHDVNLLSARGRPFSPPLRNASRRSTVLLPSSLNARFWSDN